MNCGHEWCSASGILMKPSVARCHVSASSQFGVNERQTCDSVSRAQRLAICSGKHTVIDLTIKQQRVCFVMVSKG